MEEKQFELIMQQFAQINERLNQMDKRISQVEKRIGQVEEKISQLEEKINQMDEKFEQKIKDLQIDMGIGFMRLEKKIDDQYDMCTRQHADLLAIIEKRVQESKNDRENLHQGQDALKFRVEQLEMNSKAV